MDIIIIDDIKDRLQDGMLLSGTRIENAKEETVNGILCYKGKVGNTYHAISVDDGIIVLEN